MTARGASHVYVYYRVVADTADARAAVAGLLGAVEAKTGVTGRLLARCDDPATWMEVYEPVANPAAFARTLDAMVRRLGLAAVAADGVRHTECFGPLPRAAAAARTEAG